MDYWYVNRRYRKYKKTGDRDALHRLASYKNWLTDREEAEGFEALTPDRIIELSNLADRLMETYDPDRITEPIGLTNRETEPLAI